MEGESDMIGNIGVEPVRKTLREEIDNNGIAGGNLLVIHDGKEILYHEDGFADIEQKLPIKRDTIFRLYSMTKPITAAAVMILMERGRIDLYEPVGKFLEGFRNQMVQKSDGSIVPTEREMIIKDLLSMTSGLVYGGEDKAGLDTGELFGEIDNRLLGDNPMSTLEAMNRLGKCTLAYQPGSYWIYGTSADVLGAVVEVVSGMSFGEFLHKEIFEPLGMQDTGFWCRRRKGSVWQRRMQATAKAGLNTIPAIISGSLMLWTENRHLNQGELVWLPLSMIMQDLPICS
jgi:CubicO group peptidase (beta-lactamase class C family)